MRAHDPARPGKSWRGKDAPTRRRRVAALLLAASALALSIDASWLHAKAWLAQQLLQQAWQDSRGTQLVRRPWPWADTYPVARLTIESRDVDQIVLAGDAGRSLAFGPGWAEASARPGRHGTIVISGHRDTHFAFLRDLAVGDEVTLEDASGASAFRIVSLQVADTRRDAIALGDADALLLVTCWPFDAVAPGGPLRYVVRAEPLASAGTLQLSSR
jgi:sortase A